MTTFLILQEGEQYAKENGLVFLETSAKTAQNVNELFYEIGTPYFICYANCFSPGSSLPCLWKQVFLQEKSWLKLALLVQLG